MRNKIIDFYQSRNVALPLLTVLAHQMRKTRLESQIYM